MFLICFISCHLFIFAAISLLSFYHCLFLLDGVLNTEAMRYELISIKDFLQFVFFGLRQASELFINFVDLMGCFVSLDLSNLIFSRQAHKSLYRTFLYSPVFPICFRENRFKDMNETRMRHQEAEEGQHQKVHHLLWRAQRNRVLPWVTVKNTRQCSNMGARKDQNLQPFLHRRNLMTRNVLEPNK